MSISELSIVFGGNP